MPFSPNVNIWWRVCGGKGVAVWVEEVVVVVLSGLCEGCAVEGGRVLQMFMKSFAKTLIFSFIIISYILTF